MIEKTVATYCATQLSLTLNEDVYLHDLYDSDREGISFMLLYNNDDFGLPCEACVHAVLYYYDLIANRTLQKQIADLLDSYRGTKDGSWSVTEKVESRSHGIHENRRYITEVIVMISYDKTMI